MLGEMKQFLQKDFRLIFSSKFFLISLISLIMYTVFINYGYVDFLDTQTPKVFAYDPNGVLSVSNQIEKVASIENLMEKLSENINGTGVDLSQKNPRIYLFSNNEKINKEHIDYVSYLLHSDIRTDLKVETLGESSYESNQRRAITTQLLYIELIAVGLLGITSVIFKEKQMGVLRVHGVMPIHSSMVILSKILIFLISDILFAILMMALNVGISETLNILPELVMNICVLSVVMSMIAIFLTLILKDFKQFSLAFLVIVLAIAVPVMGDIIPAGLLAWHPFYYLYNNLYDSILGIAGSDFKFLFLSVAIIMIFFFIIVFVYDREAKKEV